MARQEERRAATRGAVMRAAQKLFESKGFSATTMDEIAAAAGVAKGAVYHHFPSKEELFEAVFEAVSLGLLGRVAAVGGKDILDAMVAPSRGSFDPCAGPALRRISSQAR